MDRNEARESGYLYASTADLLRFLKEADAPKTCKTCKWWNHDGECHCPALQEFTLDGFNPGPDFGCVHWEAKDGQV